MLHVQGTLLSLQRLGPRPHRALGEVSLWHAGQSGEIVVAGGAEVGCAKAEVDSHRTAVTALVLEEISAMLGADL